MSWTLLHDFYPEKTTETLDQALGLASDLLKGDAPATVIILDELGNLCRFQTTRRIRTSASTTEGGALLRAVRDIDLDVTTAVLMMARVEVFALEDDPAAALELAYQHAPGAAAVNEARLVESICDFFAIDDLHDLTDERLEAAAQEVLGGVVKETVTLQLEVKVRRPANAQPAEAASVLQHNVWSNSPGVRVLNSVAKDV